MSNTQKTYDRLVTELKEIGLLGSVGGVLGWDEQVLLPDKGRELRAGQSGLIARLHHERFTSPLIGQMLAELESSGLLADPHGDVAVNVRQTRRSYDRATTLPAELVERMSRTEVHCQQAWVEARKKSDYGHFKPWLEKMLALKREEAQCYLSAGGDQSDRPTTLYDALLEGFEPGERAENLRRVFAELRAELVPLIEEIAGRGKSDSAEVLHRRFARDQQEQFAREAAAKIGFDFEAGRLDVSAHPFCSGIGPGDVRLTTRYREDSFTDAFFGVLHEAGHGLYHQGLPAEHFGTPCGSPVSLGIHESQSRMWENLVGRGRAFWNYFWPKAQERFGAALAGVSMDQWMGAIHRVEPSLIRVEADEATYNLHIILRFELEQALLHGDLSVDDLPGEWNRRMKQDLGVDVPDDARGCLQDIHWSGGMIGYFPTYTLGNLYAAQFFEQAKMDLSDLEGHFSRGDFVPLREWLREKIHSQGKRYSARELAQKITGQDLSAAPLMRHLREVAQIGGAV
ncbi:MAG: carboxypeptidase M32 [Phycisphaerales bacterium]|nr:carboxypeptidase M32 [Phycisphaerales bacterium]